MAEGPHPIPFRTRKLSPPAPMVLHGQPCGRVGPCRSFETRLGKLRRGSPFLAPPSFLPSSPPPVPLLFGVAVAPQRHPCDHPGTTFSRGVDHDREHPFCRT